MINNLLFQTQFNFNTILRLTSDIEGDSLFRKLNRVSH